MQRRQFTQASGLLAASFMLPAAIAESPAAASVNARLRALEKESGARLGVALLDTANGRQHGLRTGERFPMCSTFKFLAAAFVLRRVDLGQEKLDRRIAFAASDLVTYSPVTEKHVNTGMTVAELCDAAITVSDNTAANLLLASFGGPAGLTAFMRSLGDSHTRLDRIEGALNEARPGDPRDTTTPLAMLQALQKLVLGDALSPASREQLKQWLLATRTSDKKLRALMPPLWLVGDKTGSGGYGSNNDVGILWPPGRPPIIVAIYLTESTQSAEKRDAVVARAGRLAAELAGPL